MSEKIFLEKKKEKRKEGKMKGIKIDIMWM
jgi:hypothetical protein